MTSKQKKSKKQTTNSVQGKRKTEEIIKQLTTEPQERFDELQSAESGSEPHNS